MDDPRRCPRCHSNEVVLIRYGMPSPEMVEASQRGEMALGGCVVFPEAPTAPVGTVATSGAKMMRGP